MSTFEKSITVKAPLHTCYNTWSKIEMFPRFMKHIKAVKQTNRPDITHWKADNGMEWDAKWEYDEPGQAIQWRTVDSEETSTGLKMSGSVRFKAISDRETEVVSTMNYSPPAGAVGEMIAKVFSDPEKMVQDDLQNFKKVVEEQHTLTAV